MNSTKVIIETIDLAAWVNQNIHTRYVPDAIMPTDPPPTVVMKMDIEGSEYPVLVSMLVKGALCQISVITLEWHAHMCNGVWCSHTRNIPNMVQMPSLVPGCKPLRVLRFDDEAYEFKKINNKNDPNSLPV